MTSSPGTGPVEDPLGGNYSLILHSSFALETHKLDYSKKSSRSEVGVLSSLSDISKSRIVRLEKYIIYKKGGVGNQEGAKNGLKKKADSLRALPNRQLPKRYKIRIALSSESDIINFIRWKWDKPLSYYDGINES